jgi:hypothetical protein
MGEKKSKKKRKSQEKILYWSIALVVSVIILFFAAYKFYSRQPDYPKITYNNWEFTKMADTWWFEWQKGDKLYTVPLRFNPYEAKEVPLKGNLDNELFNAENYVYITFDLSNETSQDLSMLALAATELTQNMATAIERTPLAACVNNQNHACEKKPVKTCANTDEPVIHLKEGGETSITLNRNCIIVEGEGFELVKAVDRLLYQWYGIMG